MNRAYVRPLSTGVRKISLVPFPRDRHFHVHCILTRCMICETQIIPISMPSTTATNDPSLSCSVAQTVRNLTDGLEAPQRDSFPP